MIISRTPLRVSFLGGGSDLPSYYRQFGGGVLSVAINKFVYVIVNRKFDRKIRASYSVTENVEHVDELKHELIREAMKLVGVTEGVEIVSCSDIPGEGTGLGSSSTYTVGLLKALYAYAGRHVGAERLAQEACRIEIDLCGHPIGKQDQYIAAYGGVKHFTFCPDESVRAEPVICNPGTLESLARNLVMMYTGIVRSAKTILAEQSSRSASDAETKQSIGRMVRFAEQARDALTRNELDGFGELLHQGWLEKRKVATGVTSELIDSYYERGRRAGAIGGKLLGAGGGGFLLFYAHPDKQDALELALPELRRIPFRFESQGSSIIFVEE